MSDVSELSLSLSRPSLCFDKRDAEIVDKLYCVIKSCLKDRACNFISCRRSGPILLWYGSDCTPLTTRSIYKRQWQGFSVSRKGKDTREYLIQRLFVMDSLLNKTVYFIEPSRVSDETASAHLQAWLELLPSLRKLGHEHIFAFSEYEAGLLQNLWRD
jgi:hypothetical protein